MGFVFIISVLGMIVISKYEAQKGLISNNLGLDLADLISY